MTPDYRFLMPKTPLPEHALDRQWYVRVEGAVYGPYDEQTLWGYVQESRVTAHSELSLRPDRGFRPARNWQELAHWFQVQSSPVQTVPTPVPSPQIREIAPAVTSTQLLLVVANIRSGRLSLFTQTLMSLGQIRALTPSTWLIESQVDAESAKGILAPALATSDSLLVLDASEAVFASYNLGIDGDAVGLAPQTADTTGRLFGR